MAATPHTVRLYRRGVLARAVRTETVYLEPKDAGRLREVLVELATKHHPGRRFDLSHWRIEVEQQARPVHIVAKVQVDASGRTEVKR